MIHTTLIIAMTVQELQDAWTHGQGLSITITGDTPQYGWYHGHIRTPSTRFTADEFLPEQYGGDFTKIEQHIIDATLAATFDYHKNRWELQSVVWPSISGEEQRAQAEELVAARAAVTDVQALALYRANNQVQKDWHAVWSKAPQITWRRAARLEQFLAAVLEDKWEEGKQYHD